MNDRHQRKTVRIARLLAKVNHRNRFSTCDPLKREGWNDLLETILMEGNVYAGFSYLDKGNVPEGKPPGIIRAEKSENNTYPDESRRAYYIHRTLTDDYGHELKEVFATNP